MLITSVQSFKLIAWKLWEDLITQTCYPILKHNLKIVFVENAIILSNIIFLLVKSHMHIFNMLMCKVSNWLLENPGRSWLHKLTTLCWRLTSKLSKSKMPWFCQKLFFDLQKFTCTSSTYPQHVCMVSKWSIENCKKSWLHKLHTPQCKKLPTMTYNASSCLRWLSSKGCNSVKINSSSIKKPHAHAHFQYVHNKYARFQNDPLKTVRGVDYTNSIPYLGDF